MDEFIQECIRQAKEELKFRSAGRVSYPIQELAGYIVDGIPPERRGEYPNDMYLAAIRFLYIFEETKPSSTVNSFFEFLDIIDYYGLDFIKDPSGNFYKVYSDRIDVTKLYANRKAYLAVKDNAVGLTC